MAGTRNVLFRVDGGPEVGMGHVVRSLALAQQLRTRIMGNVSFIMRDFEAGVAKVRQAGFEVDVIPVDENIDHTVSLIQKRQPALIVTDIHEIENGYVRRLRCSSHRIACLTGLGWIEVGSDIVINGDIRYQKQVTVNRYGARCFLGTDFFILREGFAEVVHRKKPIRDNVELVLVTLGGSDILGVGGQVVQALDAVRADFRVIIVLGSAFVETQDFKTALMGAKREFIIKKDLEDMASPLYEADLAIAGGGFTMYELAAAGTPALVLCQAEHQLETATAFAQAGTCINLGMGNLVSQETLVKAVTGLVADIDTRGHMSHKGKSLIDARGIYRVSNILTHCLVSSG